mgnify:CR=1 FL=1
MSKRRARARGGARAIRVARAVEERLHVCVALKLEAQRRLELAEAVVVEGDGPVLLQEGRQVGHDALVVPAGWMPPL